MKIKALRPADQPRTSKSGTGNLIWDYEITNATPAEKAKYKKVMGTYYVETEKGNPLHFSQMWVGEDANLDWAVDKKTGEPYTYCPEAKAAKIVVQQGRKMGINVEKSFATEMNRYLGFIKFSSSATTTDQPAEEPVEKKKTAKPAAKRRNLSRM